MADTTTTIEVMLFEGGALVHLLGNGTQNQALADKIAQADESALSAGQTSFSIDLDPIELGIAFEATGDAQSLLAQSLAQKLRDALAAKLQDLGISYDGNGAGAQTPDSQGSSDASQPNDGSSQSQPAQPMSSEDSQGGQNAQQQSASDDSGSDSSDDGSADGNAL